MADSLTEALRIPGGEMRLRDIQGKALLDIYECRGGLLPVPVGGGKTLISYLIPVVLKSRRPLLLLPAALIEKTRREFTKLKRHFRFVEMEIVSYQKLARKQQADYLENLDPDCIIADEAHFLKNPGTAVCKRMNRFLEKRAGNVSFIAMTGTLVRKSLLEFAHLSRWALGAQSPAPLKFNTTMDWARALDVNPPGGERWEPGALRVFQEPGETVREGYRKRLIDTPGVVASEEPPLPMELRAGFKVTDNTAIDFRPLRLRWERPDGKLLLETIEMWRTAREMSLGFYNMWDPAPPKLWALARKNWWVEMREILKSNRSQWDTPEQVRDAVDQGLARRWPHARTALQEWEAVKDTFKPNTVAKSLSDQPLLSIVSTFGDGPPPIVWVEYPHVGRRLAQLTGLPYFGAGDDGIEKLAGQPVIASIRANGTGKNLQHGWSRNIITSPPSNGAAWEQMLGRTHRDGQASPLVTAEIWLGCREHVSGMLKALSEAQYSQEMTGQAQKLCHTAGVVEGLNEAGYDANAPAWWSASRVKKELTRAGQSPSLT